jgi:hypothetical protein
MRRILPDRPVSEKMAAMSGRDLRTLFKPRSVAAGASNDRPSVAAFQRRVHDSLLERA